VPPSVYGYNKTLDIRPAYDEKKAKALLTEAGYPNGFSATLPCLATGEFVCNVVAGTLAKVGISITVDVVPIAKALADARSGKAEMGMVLFFYSNFDVGMGLQDLFHSNGSRNFGMYSNPELDKIIDAQSVEIDPSKRLTMINQALAMIKEDAPKPVMFFPVFYFGMQDNVDIKMNKLSLPLFRDVKINHQ
ncbi:MAG: hypothetical protein KDH94_05215, partial [Coxiellaceae bacterium]|nr:hypothetical protein [Coxiellaceae bacterium]